MLLHKDPEGKSTFEDTTGRSNDTEDPASMSGGYGNYTHNDLC